MACFLAPAAEAVVTTVVQKKIEGNEKKEAPEKSTKISWTRKLKWLNAMLWGGSALLCVEHIWHGEVVPWPPFLTAMNTPSEIVPMLKEIALYGTAMAALITVIWFVIAKAADKLVESGKLQMPVEAESHQ